MREEEKKAIRIINIRTKRLIEELNVELTDEEPDEPRVAYLTQQIEANKTLLNLVEKQQKEIEDLKAITRTYEAYSVREDGKIVIASKEYFINGFFKDFLSNYVSKDKIKELREIDNIDLIQFKIKELLGEINK